jgi:hypothetical protein
VARTRTLVSFAAFSVACASPSATISVTVGPDAGPPGCTSDALTRAPAVATFELDAVGHDGSRQTLADGGIAQANVDLGDVAEEAIASLQLTGRDASNNAVLFGATPFVQLGALDGATIPLFVQRKGEFACMPGAIADGRTAPLLAANPRGIYYGGGTITGATGNPVFGGYDLLFLDGFATTCDVGVAARSLSLVELTNQTSDGDSAVAALIADNAIYELGLPSCGFSEIKDSDLADGGTLKSWSEVAGGRAINGDDGTGFVVGPSKLDATSNTIVSFPTTGADGGPPRATVAFAAKRQGAAVAWLPNGGIFIYGGAAEPGAPGIEILNSTLAASKLGDYPLDPVQGLAAAQLDGTHMIVAGDMQPPRVVDVTCEGGCATTPWGQGLPMTLSSPSLFPLGGGAFLIVGDDATGATHAFRMTETDAPKEVLLRIPRIGARAVQTETGEVIILGGGSDVPESYFD